MQLGVVSHGLQSCCNFMRTGALLGRPGHAVVYQLVHIVQPGIRAASNHCGSHEHDIVLRQSSKRTLGARAGSVAWQHNQPWHTDS